MSPKENAQLAPGKRRNALEFQGIRWRARRARCAIHSPFHAARHRSFIISMRRGLRCGSIREGAGGRRGSRCGSIRKNYPAARSTPKHQYEYEHQLPARARAPAPARVRATSTSTSTSTSYQYDHHQPHFPPFRSTSPLPPTSFLRYNLYSQLHPSPQHHGAGPTHAPPHITRAHPGRRLARRLG